MKRFQEEKTKAAVQFIFTSIFLAVAAIFYLKLYRPFKLTPGSIVEKFSTNFKNGFIFLAISGVWFIMLISTMVRNSRINKVFRPSFVTIFGTLLLIAEMAGYAFVIYYLLR